MLIILRTIVHILHIISKHVRARRLYKVLYYNKCTDNKNKIQPVLNEIIFSVFQPEARDSVIKISQKYFTNPQVTIRNSRQQTYSSKIIKIANMFSVDMSPETREKLVEELVAKCESITAENPGNRCCVKAQDYVTTDEFKALSNEGKLCQGFSGFIMCSLLST